jgi:glycosyltransferase involved in cell wall biosynthesis
MTVYFFTGGFTHNLHREEYRAPPDNVRFIPSTRALERGVTRSELRRKTRAPFPRARFRQIGLSLFERIGIPKVKAIRPPACDLIHSAQDPLLTRRPWVVEVEDVTAFFWYRRRILARRTARRVVEGIFGRGSCRAILPWTDAARRSLMSGLNTEAFAHKIQTVYPCIAPRKRATPSRDIVKFLFVGSTFFTKGGIETIRAFQRLKEPRASLVMVAPVPPSVAREASRDPRITIAGGIPDEELQHHYETASAFVLPVHADTFGFVFLEAMAHGVPCIATSHFAVPEIITHEKTGLIVEAENSYFDSNGLPEYDSIAPDGELVARVREPSSAYVGRLHGAMQLFCEDPRLREALSEGAFQEIERGKFSQATRRAVMQQVYSTACGDPR